VSAPSASPCAPFIVLLRKEIYNYVCDLLLFLDYEAQEVAKAGKVARTEQTRNAQRVWMGNPLENIYLEELQVDGEIILKQIIRVSVILHLITVLPDFFSFPGSTLKNSVKKA
jgi:hypothetical protein